MVPEGLKEHVVASTAPSAIVTALLFMASGVEPERIVGTESQVETRSRARSSFVALTNLSCAAWPAPCCQRTWPSS